MTIEVSAKKVEDAIKQGLAQLGAELDQVNVEVIESGGLFKKAKVRLTLEEPKAEEKPAEKPTEQPKKQEQKPEPKKEPAPQKATTEKKDDKKQEKASSGPKAPKKPAAPEAPVAEKPKKQEKAPEKKEHVKTEEEARASEETRQAAMAQALEFVKTVVEKMGFEGVETTVSGDVISLAAPDGDDSLIIGRHGETLSALSFLAETLGRAEKHHISVTVDCNGYRGRRADSLTAMAKRRANECANKHRKIKLEAMERIDRRTIHNALTGDDRVTTASEGKEPYRYVVIYPKKK